MARIELAMTTIDALTVMCDGNPGAMQVLAALVKHKQKAARGRLDVLLLDDLSIYGADIWVLYKDTCRCDLDELHKELLRLGTLSYDRAVAG